MSREVARRIASSLLVLLVARAEDCRAQIVIDAHRHHLGTAGRPEWREYAGSTPEGQSLELRFEGRANPAYSGSRLVCAQPGMSKPAEDIFERDLS
jgi:hypothetical protein